MKLAIIIGLVAFLNTAQAKVSDVKPTVETPSVKAELMSELDETPEDLDFDADDQFLNTVDDESLMDSEIEKIALDKKTDAPKIEAKATTKTTVKKN